MGKICLWGWQLKRQKVRDRSKKLWDRSVRFPIQVPTMWSAICDAWAGRGRWRRVTIRKVKIRSSC